MLSLSDFRDTSVAFTPSQAADYMAEHIETFETYKTVWIYDGSCFIGENPDGSYHLILGQSDWIGERADLERRLYLDWYLSEIADEIDTFGLTEALYDFCAMHNLKPASADDMLAETDNPEQRQWLSWFIDAWEDAQCREDNARFGNRA